MSKTVCFFVFSCFLLQLNLAASKNLVDEVKQQLDDLKTIVQTDIMIAQNDLKMSDEWFLRNNNSTLDMAVLIINFHKETIDGQLTTIKELATGENIDISSCTTIREELLKRMPEECDEKIRTCIDQITAEEIYLLASVNYVIDVAISKVHNLEFQLNQCQEDLLCISPLVTEIELDKVRLPQSIRKKVDEFDNAVVDLNELVDACRETNVSAYVSESLSTIQDIIDCVNGLSSF